MSQRSADGNRRGARPFAPCGTGGLPTSDVFQYHRHSCLSTSQARFVRLHHILPPVLFIALFCFYVSLRPLVSHVSDSYAWVNTVDTSSFDYFFHPHHVLYLVLAWRWNELVRLFAPSISTWAAMAALSSLFGCAGIAALYLTLRTLGASRAGALSGASLPAFAFGYWFFASDAEVYTISAACVLWTFYFFARLTVDVSPLPPAGAENRRGDACVARGVYSGMALWAGVSAGFAALFHQTGIFAFLPAAVVIISLKRRAVHALLFTVGFGAVVTPVYVAAAWSALPRLTPLAFVRWLFLFGGEGYGGFTASRVLHAPLGAARGLIGGQAILDVLRGARHADFLLWAGLAASLAALVAGVIFLLASLRRVHSAGRAPKTIALAAIAAFVLYAAFSAYFDSSNFEWWTIPMPLLAMALAVPALTVKRPAVLAAVSVVAALFVANLCLDFAPRREADRDFVLNAARQVAANTTPRDLIVAPGYLGSLIWYEHRDRNVFCPDKAVRMRGQGGMMDVFVSEASVVRESGGHIVIAGADKDDSTAAFTRELLSRVSESDRSVIGQIIFLDGGRRLVQTVGPVPLIAVNPSSILGASRRDIARSGGSPR